MSHEGASVCKQLEEYLLSKLAKDHAGVKLKVLRIIRYVCENGGSIEFKRLLQRRSDVIRQCQSYRGSADPLRGDAPNKEVRDESQNVMKALFASENMTSMSAVAPGNSGCIPQSRIQSVSSAGFGYSAPSTVTSPTTQSNAQGGRYMASCGNPNFDNFPTSTPPMSFSSIMSSDNPGRDLISAVTSGVQSVAETLAKTAQPYISKQSSVPRQYSSSPFPTTPHYSPPSWVPPKVEEALQSSTQPSDSEVRRVVNELCLANSARTNPTKQSLDLFVSKAENLDGSCLGEVLASKLSDPQTSWVHKVKILAGIEAVHACGLDLVITSFLEKGGASSLMMLLSSVQCGAKARQVANLLQLTGEVVSKSQPGPPSEQLICFDEPLVIDNESTNCDDLLIFDDAPPSVAISTPPASSLI